MNNVNIRLLVVVCILVTLCSCADILSEVHLTPSLDMDKISSGNKLPLSVGLYAPEDMRNNSYTSSCVGENLGYDLWINGGSAYLSGLEKYLSSKFEEVNVTSTKNEKGFDLFFLPHIDCSIDVENLGLAVRGKNGYATLYNLSVVANIELVLDTISENGFKEEFKAFGESSKYYQQQYVKGVPYKINLTSKQIVEEAMDKSFFILTDNIENSSSIESYSKKAEARNTLPSKIKIIVLYSDNNSLQPNKIINAGEKSEVIVKVLNQGEGTAFAVKIFTKSDFQGISIPDILSVGDIRPGDSKEIIIPIQSDLNILTGLVDLQIIAREKRGYDSRPVQLQIKTAKLQRPDLQIASYEFNDFSGLSLGNGNSKLENNETIELISLVQNTGLGPGLGVVVGIKDVSDGIEIVKAEDGLATVGKNDQRKAKLAFKIPRTYSNPTIDYTLYVSDIRGITTEKKYSIPFESSAPILGISYQVLDDNGREVPGLENGKSYLLEIVPTNKGSNLAEGVELTLLAPSSKVKIEHFDSIIGELDSNGAKRVVTIPFSLDRSYLSSTLEVVAELKQDDFPDLRKKITLPVVAHRPDFEYETTLLNGLSRQDVMQNTTPKFRVSIRNNGDLDAKDVSIHFKVSHPTISFEKIERVGTIVSGEGQYRDFNFFVRGDADLSDMSVIVEVEQADFDNNNRQIFAFHIKPQTAIVQSVAAVGGTGSSVGGSLYYQAPQVYVNSPNEGEETFSKTINLHGSILALGAGNDIEKISISVNDKPVQLVQYADNIRSKTNRLTQRHIGGKVVFDGKIALEPEMNRVEIRCVDRNNQEQKQVINVMRKARLGNIYAVVIGISHFANTSFDLKYAASDSQKFYNFLKSDVGGKVPPNRMKLLVNENANRAAIIKALTRFLGMAGPDDTVELYLATHGVIGGDGTLYYLAHNTEMDNLFGTAFSSRDLEEIVGENIRAGRVIIYLDACHSGQSGLSGKMYAKRRSLRLHEVNQANNSLAAQLSKFAKGVTTFSASSAQGFSNEDSRWGGGVFTYHLLKGLNGAANDDGNEWITISELDRYLASEVRVDTNGEQQPKMNSTLPSDTPVAHLGSK